MKTSSYGAVSFIHSQQKSNTVPYSVSWSPSCTMWNVHHDTTHHDTHIQKCHTLRPSFDKLAVSYPHITFVDVPILETNTNLHQGLGVQTVPYGHIYHPINGLVVETKLSRSTLGEFVDLMMMHSSSWCRHWVGSPINNLSRQRVRIVHIFYMIDRKVSVLWCGWPIPF